ncbi:Uncharacterized protein Rs2_15934 [Raphanus sativus]|nr:Uncharacterized protein Rs2_15934 [Raphanus sativus]
MSGHAPPLHASIKSYHILPVFIRTNHGSHPSSISWNFHETSFCTASTFKAVHAFESGVRPSPFYSDHLRVSLGHRGSLGCVHPGSNTTQGSCITSHFSSHETAFLHTTALKAALGL